MKALTKATNPQASRANNMPRLKDGRRAKVGSYVVCSLGQDAKVVGLVYGAQGNDLIALLPGGTHWILDPLFCTSVTIRDGRRWFLLSLEYKIEGRGTK